MIINTVFIGPSIWALNDLPAAFAPNCGAWASATGWGF
jgi:hypothetical protein